MLSFLDSTGHERFLGNNPAPVRLKWGVFGDGNVPNAVLIPKDQWKPVSLEGFLPAHKDQDGVGACNAFDTINVIETCRTVQGLSPIQLWAGELYGRINGGRDEGSLLEDAIDAAMKDGVIPFPGGVKDYDWRTRPADWREQAKRFRILEAYLCPTFEHLGSAVQNGFMLSLGVMWGDKDGPDGDGWLSPSPRGGAGGHAIAGYGLAYRNGQWGLNFRNSWGQRWGLNGNAILPSQRFQGGGVGGWWACRSVTDDGSGIPIFKG